MSALAATYLLVQLLVPAVLLARRGARSTDFSWDMFSHALRCSRLDVRARARGSGAAWGSVRLDLDFANWAQLARVLQPSRLDAYASWLCAKLREEEGRPVEVHFAAACTDDRDGAALGWIDSERDYCAAPP